METALICVSLINHYMNANQIKDAHILDILFEGRNKDYGAYELRKTYNRRIIKSLFAMGGLIGLLFLGSAVAGHGKKAGPLQVDSDVVIQNVKEPDVTPPPVPLPPKPQLQVATIRMTTPVVVPDNKVPPDEHPPVTDDAIDRKIGLATQDGGKDVGIDGPPVSAGIGSGVVEKPKASEGDNRFEPVEVEASFPGGSEAWARFLNRNLRVPEDAISNGIEGMVIVQFVVDVNGTVSDVQAISGPDGGGLKEEAVRVIQKSGKWVPAIQNGRSVKAYRKQPVIFKIDRDN